MLVRVEHSEFSWHGRNKIAYVFNMTPWNTRKLRALSFVKKERETNENFLMMSIFGGVFSFMPGIGTLIAWDAPGYIPATIWGAVGTAALVGATVPHFVRKLRTPRHDRALELAASRNHAILLYKNSDGGWVTNAYSMTALLKTPAGKKLKGMFKADAATNKQEILAQLTPDSADDRLFLKFKPVLDEYFRNTAEMDIELMTARATEEASRPTAEIAKNEKEIDAFAAEVAIELANIAKLHQEEVDSRAKTSMEMASDNLRMARDAFRLQRGQFLPEDE